MASADHSPYQFAAERYILGELSEDEKLDFEDHYFSCEACAQDVEDLTAIRVAAPSALRELDAKGSKRQPLSWFSAAWLRPLALGALSLLIGVTGYQNLVQIPRLNAEMDESAGLSEEPTPIKAERKKEEILKFRSLPRIHVFVIRNDWGESYPRYKAQVTRNGSNNVLFERTGTVAEGKDLRVAIPARKLGPGTFKLVIVGESQTARPTDVANLNFEITGE